MRTHHPYWSHNSIVYMVVEITQYGKKVIFIPVTYNQIKNTNAHGYKIHIVMRLKRPNSIKYLYHRPDLVERKIRPWRMLIPYDLNTISTMFTISVRVRILIAVWVIVLFNWKINRYAYRKERLANTIGKLYVNYEILDNIPTITTTLTGCVLANKPKKYIF